MPCDTSRLLVNLQYLDMSDNLLTDMTVEETLCNGDGSLKDLRLLNISGNALKVSLNEKKVSCVCVFPLISPSQLCRIPAHTTKLLQSLSVFLLTCPTSVQSLSTMSRLVQRLYKLTHLDISRTDYSSMPQQCSWPSTLRHLNISGAKLITITPCLPTTVQVLNMNYEAVNLQDLGPSHQTLLFCFFMFVLFYRCWT